MSTYSATKHAVVAGGAGFLGSHLCDLLLDRGYRVTCVDNLITGSRDNIAHNLQSPDFSFVQSDIATYEHSADPIDVIFHLASPASPVDYQRLPLQTLDAGSSGTRRALDLAEEHDAAFVLASTSEVYGDPLVHPQDEGYWGNVNPTGPRAVYDEAKRFAEAMTTAYRVHCGVQTRIARIFNTYGPRMRCHDGRVVPEMIMQGLSGEPITVYGDGSQTRSFCYVSDEIEGLHRLYESGVEDPVNIGSPRESTILEFAEMVRQLTDTDNKIVFRPLPTDDPHRRQPDISRAREHLGWEPAISLEVGLAKTVDYFRAMFCLQPAELASSH